MIRQILIGIGLLFITVLASCSDDDKNPEDASEGKENEVFNLSFESGNESFYTTSDSNNPRYPLSPKQLKPLENVTSDNNNCGNLFIGTSDEFTLWNEYDFRGNNTTFLGLNMGACKGTFTAGASRKFTLTEPLRKVDTALKFKYYMPGDFTGWEDNDYSFKVYIFEESNLEKAHIVFHPKINDTGWVEYSRKIARDMPVGNYYLMVQMANGSMAIDDIKLVKEMD